MLVAGLRHFMELTDTTPAPARRLAERLASIVRAATSRPAGQAWLSALSCNRRPQRRPCPGRIEVRRTDLLPGSIRWRCSNCGDDGLIGGSERSPFDLRPAGAVEPSKVSVSVSSYVSCHTKKATAVVEGWRRAHPCRRDAPRPDSDV